MLLLQPASTLYARVCFAMKRSEERGRFVEAHQLNAKTVRKSPKDMIGKCLSQRQASRLLKEIAS